MQKFGENLLPFCRILKNSSKTGDRVTAISNLQNNEKRVSFQPGNRQPIRKSSKQFYSP